ncbi:MAG: ComF family protein [Verrucomicrobiaceae bacterium]|nr:ComF family protein [Verrucomicrobiaceae bacterium]
MSGGKRILAGAVNWLPAARRALINVCFPRVCRVCDVFLPEWEPHSQYGEWFCASCEKQLHRVEPPFCARCGEAYDGAIQGEFKCDNCAGRDYDFDFAIAGYHAEGAVRELIHKFKYGGDLGLRECLGAMLLTALDDPRFASERLQDWVLVPVPLHGARRREREFNQSEELCLQVSRARNIPFLEALRRIRSTGHQASLTRKQRLENLKSAFEVKKAFRGESGLLAGRKVLLVDDVFTTGATTHACARVLTRHAGVEKVVVITVARG